MQFSKPVDKVRGEMSSIHIRHVLPAKIRTFLYNGVVYLSTFKANQNKYMFVTFFLIQKIKAVKTYSCSSFVKFSKGRHFTIKNFYDIKLNCFLELHKNLKYVIKNDGFFMRFFRKVVSNLKNGKSNKISVFNGLFLTNQNFQ